MKKKNFKVTRLGILTGALICTIGVSLLGVRIFSEKKIVQAQEEENIVQELEESISLAIEKTPTLKFSSNPYDYVENNEYYDSIIARGVEILPALEEALVAETKNENFGLVPYLIAAAMEEISQVEVNQVLFEEEEKSWGASMEFLEQWTETKEVLPEKIEEILDSSISNEMKIEKIDTMGILAVPVLETEIQEKVDAELVEKIEEHIESFSLTEEEKEIISKIEEK